MVKNKNFRKKFDFFWLMSERMSAYNGFETAVDGRRSMTENHGISPSKRLIKFDKNN